MRDGEDDDDGDNSEGVDDGGDGHPHLLKTLRRPRRASLSPSQRASTPSPLYTCTMG